MRFVVPVVVLAILAAGAPVRADAAELEVILSLPVSGHENHPALIPESGRLIIPIDVEIKATDFVCLQEATFTINVVMTAATSIDTYGASPEPDATTVKIPAGAPGSGSKPYKADKPLGLGVFWGDTRPKTNAKETYTITVTDLKAPDGGPCAPPYTVKAGALQVYTVGVDIIEPANQTGANCALARDDPACLETPTVEAKGESPGFDPMLFSLVTLGVVFTLRRRRF